MFDRYANLFDACAQVGLADPGRVRLLEVRDVAAILGANRPAVAAAAFVWPADAPINAAAARSALAHKEGRERPTRDTPPPSREEFRRMLELARGATRKSG